MREFGAGRGTDAEVGAEGNAAEGKKLNGLLRARVRELGSYIVLESDLVAWRVGGFCAFPSSEAARNERSFEEERQRTLRKREWTTKPPLPCRERGVAGEGDQLPRVSVAQHGGGGFLPSQKTPHSSPHPNQRHLHSFKTVVPRHVVIRMSNYDATVLLKCPIIWRWSLHEIYMGFIDASHLVPSSRSHAEHVLLYSSPTSQWTALHGRTRRLPRPGVAKD
jgi:hypothetical protein